MAKGDLAKEAKRFEKEILDVIKEHRHGLLKNYVSIELKICFAQKKPYLTIKARIQ